MLKITRSTKCILKKYFRYGKFYIKSIIKSIMKIAIKSINNVLCKKSQIFKTVKHSKVTTLIF